MAEERINEALPEGLKAERMPKHVAVILDGNRRWAKERGMAVWLGHEEGKNVMMDLIFLSNNWRVKVLSLFVFSTENWTRPKEEVEFLMMLFEGTMGTYLEDFHRNNIRVTIMGDRSNIPESILHTINTAEEKTKSNKGLHVLFCFNYSGRFDIMQATKSIAIKAQQGMLQIEDINETLIEQELQTNCAHYPVPDLLIRTSGEQRISNFMLWQLAYTELYFVTKNFPEFEEQDYVDALIAFQQRERRFGGKKYK